MNNYGNLQMHNRALAYSLLPIIKRQWASVEVCKPLLGHEEGEADSFLSPFSFFLPLLNFVTPRIIIA